MGSLYPFAIDVNAGYFLQEMTEQKVIVASGGVKTLEPDYICFIAYSYAVVKYLEAKHPDVEKIDFIVERNGDITKHIQEFHSHFAINLSLRGDEHLADMVGELIPAGKDHIPLQAADVLCWHMGRSRNPKSMDDDDLRRYNILAGRKGKRIILANDIIKGLKDAFDKYKPSER